MTQVTIKQVKGLSGALASKMNADGSNMVAKIRIITDSSTILASNDVVCIVSRTSATTVTLPVSPDTGKIVVIKDGNGNAETYNITIQGNGRMIDGVPSKIINTNYASLTLVYNGTSWNII